MIAKYYVILKLIIQLLCYHSCDLPARHDISIFLPMMPNRSGTLRLISEVLFDTSPELFRLFFKVRPPEAALSMWRCQITISDISFV